MPAPSDYAERTRTSAIWEAKGATAILYDSEKPKDHDSLYNTIGRWAGFATDPSDGAGRKPPAS